MDHSQIGSSINFHSTILSFHGAEHCSVPSDLAQKSKQNNGLGTGFGSAQSGHWFWKGTNSFICVKIRIHEVSIVYSYLMDSSD